MVEVCTIALDIAKNKFQVHSEGKRGKKTFDRQFHRYMMTFFPHFPVIVPRQGRPFVINYSTDYLEYLGEE